MNNEQRNSRATGMTKERQSALERIKEAKKGGGKRLEQVKKVKIKLTKHEMNIDQGGIDQDIEMDDFIEDDGILQ